MLHTIDPSVDATDQAIHHYLAAVDDKPVRYEDADGHVVNTSGCRGLVAWYVLIEALPDAVLVTPIRLGLGTGMRGIATRHVLRQPARIALPAHPESVDGFTCVLAVIVGLALDDVARGRTA